MDKKKIDIVTMAAGAKKSAAEAVKKTKDKVVKVIDQNDDGKVNFKNVTEIAGALGKAVKNKASSVKNSANERARMLELKALQPIFEVNIDSADFSMTKLIRICERDKKRMESEACQGSIGYHSDQKELKLINIFRENIDKFNISFFPDSSYEFYYVDPRDRDSYIALDEYFSYLKVERINELQKIAQDLGAKHFKVTYKEEKTAFTEKNAKTHNKVADKLDVNYERSHVENQYSTVEIAAEMECPGHAPVMPNLKYLQKDTPIQTLISMRMDERSPITHQKFLLKLSNSSGIKESDAIKIDAVLKELKYSGNATVTGEAKNESRRYLEYEIDF